MAKWWNITQFFKRDDNAEATTQQTTANPTGNKRTTPRTGAGLQFFYASTDTATAVATVYRCVQLLSDSVAGLHLQYMKLKGDRYQEDKNNDLHYLLTVQPQPEMSILTFGVWPLR